MNEDYIEKKVIEVIHEQLGESIAIERETRLFEIGDSLDRVEVIMELEDEFELAISDADQEKLNTVGDLIDYVEQQTKVAAATSGAPETGVSPPE